MSADGINVNQAPDDFFRAEIPPVAPPPANSSTVKPLPCRCGREAEWLLDGSLFGCNSCFISGTSMADWNALVGGEQQPSEVERLRASLVEMTRYRDNAANHMRRIRAEATTFEKERDQLKAENEVLRKIISDSATACGAAVSVECSLEFMAMLPGEIGLVVNRLKSQVATLQAEPNSYQSGHDAGQRSHKVTVDRLKAECEALRKDAGRANYWKQRAKSAEGHLFAGDWRAAALELHRYSRFESTPWSELTGQQQALISSAAGSVIACVNAMRAARKPKDGADAGETVWCACGDGYPANSYGAGFMAANEGVCENCDAANLCASQSTSAKIADALGRHKREIAAERAAVKREGLVEAQKACDRIAGDFAGRTDRERKGAGECSAAIRALIAAMIKEQSHD